MHNGRRSILKSFFMFRFERSLKTKRALNGQPVSLLVEYMMVYDSSVFNKYTSLLGTSDLNVYAAFMKILSSQLTNAVCILKDKHFYFKKLAHQNV